MVVGDDQHVNVRNVFRRVYVASRKGLIDEGQGRCPAAEYRVDENLLAVQLHAVGGMSHPDDNILLRVKGLQIRFLGNHGVIRNQPLRRAAEQKAHGGFKLAGLYCFFNGLDGPEPSFIIMGRLLDPFQPLAGWRPAELGALAVEISERRKGEK